MPYMVYVQWHMYNDTKPAAIASLIGAGTDKQYIELGINTILNCTYSREPTATLLWYK